jgi:TRAP-type mannitol/chloroaromatic compound transport system substrate-binding protein
MTTRRNFTIGAGLAAGVLAAPAVARAQTQKWRLVTSWPKRLPGPGMSAERIAERFRALSGGRLDITVHAAVKSCRRSEVLSAVGNGVADISHTAVLLAGQDAGGALLHHGALRADAEQARRLVDAGGGRRCGTSSMHPSA